MKHRKKQLNTQRQVLDVKIHLLQEAGRQRRPARGWLRAVREALGMTAKQLGERIGTDAAGVLRFEQGEVNKTISIASLEKAAQAMGCKLVYAIVPQNEEVLLEALVEKRAREVAERIIKQSNHNMALENQSVDQTELQRQVYELARQLKDTLDRRLWENP